MQVASGCHAGWPARALPGELLFGVAQSEILDLPPLSVQMFDLVVDFSGLSK